MTNPKSKIQNPKSTSALQIVTASVEDTQALGEHLGRLLQPGSVIALHGELGSGKTTLIQGIAKGLGRDPETIKSPTFVLMREYPGTVRIVHIDGYRLAGAPSVSWLDLDLVFSPGAITLIEWAERFGELLPADRLEVRLSHVSANRRRLVFVSHGAAMRKIVEQLQQSAQSEQSGTAQESRNPQSLPAPKNQGQAGAIRNPQFGRSAQESDDGHPGD